MAITSKHPSYQRYATDWKLMRDAYEGERVVKEANIEYLPPLRAHLLDGMEAGKPGRADYDAYKLRARFPDYVSDAVEMFIGLLHSKPATIELPTAMQAMLERATIDGEGLQSLLRRINVEQLVTGRLGLLADLPAGTPGPDVMPYIAIYCGEAIPNWDNSADHTGINALELVVLDESGEQRDEDLDWKHVERYRLLRLGAAALNDGSDIDDSPLEDAVPNDVTEGVGEPVYQYAVLESTQGISSIDPALMHTPMWRGAALDEIPFVFVNSKDIVSEPDNPPLLPLGRLCMTIYRGESDYRQTLYMQSQETLVVIGSNQDTNDAIRVGAGSRIDLDVQGDAKYIGVSAAGLAEVRLSLENDKKEAQSKAGTLISPAAGKQESGDALTTRLAAQTAALTQIAKAGACGLENVLKKVAKWMGQDPDKVLVTPNLEFAPVQLTGQDVSAYMAARTLGAPLSLKSLHGVFVDTGLTGMTYEDELEQIAEEELERAKLTASLPQPPAPPAPAPTPANGPAPAPAPTPAE